MANRLTQHRAKRELAKAKEHNDLRKENNQLKRAVKRLEKEISRKLALVDEAAEQGLEEVAERAPKKSGCPECDSESVRVITLQNKTYSVCKDCGWRKKVANG